MCVHMRVICCEKLSKMLQSRPHVVNFGCMLCRCCTVHVHIVVCILCVPHFHGVGIRYDVSTHMTKGSHEDTAKPQA